MKFEQKEKRTHEEIVQINQSGRSWLYALHSALRTSEFHDSENSIFDPLIEELLNFGSKIQEEEGVLDVRILDDQFFLNGLWIKPKLTEKNNLFNFADFLQSRHLGGLTLRSQLSNEDWRNVLRHFGQTKSTGKDRPDRLNQGLSESRMEAVEFHPTILLAESEPEDLPLPMMAYQAVTIYAKALLALREFPVCLDDEERIMTLRKAQRVICEFVDLCQKSPRLFFSLSLLRNVESYFYHHGVNVLVLSLALGRHLGISRSKLVDLGMAALFHDVGKLQIDESLLSKESSLTKEEWEKIRDHPTESARIFLSLDYQTPSLMERIVVAYQHHWLYEVEKRYPQPRREIEMSLFARIVAITVMYDALTTDKNYRGAFTPFEALRIMARHVSQDNLEIFRAFSSLLGPIPAGSWIRLETGHAGLVASSGRFAPTPPYPLVLIINPDETRTWMDTGKEDRKIGKRPSVAADRAQPDRVRNHLAQIFLHGDHVIY